MTRILLAITIFAVGFASCNKEQPLTKEQIKQKIDSAVAARTRESDEQARVDLERRIKIEVRVKADSIHNAMVLKEAGDTVKHVAPASPVVKKPTIR